MTKISPKLTRLIAVVLVVVIGYGAGLFFGGPASSGLRGEFNRWVSLMESAYTNQFDARLNDRKGQSEYLITLSGDQSSSNHMAFLESHKNVTYLSDSIYPNTIRVAVNIPVGETIKEIEAQPFTRFVVKNYPFLFCH